MKILSFRNCEVTSVKSYAVTHFTSIQAAHTANDVQIPEFNVSPEPVSILEGGSQPRFR